jgi:hypothetical protein
LLFLCTGLAAFLIYSSILSLSTAVLSSPCFTTFYMVSHSLTHSLTHLLHYLLTYLHSSTHFICIFGTANVVLPDRGSQTFVSTIGQLDARVDLQFMDKQPFKPQLGNRALMDLCIMSSKLAYENPLFIQNVVNLRWMMHFVAFYDCWNGKC